MANRTNLANSVLASGIGTSDTSLTVYSGDGAIFPDAPFYLTLTPKNSISQISNSEIVLVTAVTDDTFTITRARRGTSAKAFPADTIVSNGIYTQDIVDMVYPVGSIYTEITGTNPATTFGVGTWEAFGAGRVMVGYDSGDTDFDTAEETGGAKEVASAAHTHTMAHTHSISHTHTYSHQHDTPFSGESGGIFWNSGASGGASFTPNKYANTGTPGGSSTRDRTTSQTASTTSGASTGTSGGASTSTTSSVAPDPTSVVQPYIVVYFWKRTA